MDQVTAASQQPEFFDPATIDDPHPFYRRTRERTPVFEAMLPGHNRRVFVVTSFDLVRRVMEDHWAFSSDFVDVMMQGAEPHPEADALFEQGFKQISLLLNLDEPQHRRYRALATTVFTPRQAANLQPIMDAIIDGLIDSVIERGECDFIEEIAVPYPTRIISDMLGYDRDRYDDMRRWSDAITSRVGQSQNKDDDLATVQTIIEYQKFNMAMVADRRAHPRDDLISHIVQARVAGEAPLTDREAVILIQEIGVAGNETTRNTLIGGFAMLLRQPELLARLKHNPSLIPGAVEEILRLHSPVSGMWRLARTDVVLDGVEIPAGSIVMVRMEAANHDPRQFRDPETLDPQRQNRSTHLAFGFGVHYCIGNMLARRELTTAFTRLLARLEDPRIIDEGTDLSRVPSLILVANKALRIAFTPGVRCREELAA